jgi:sodium-dependent dicarboxylate transporter 2/3/5
MHGINRLIRRSKKRERIGLLLGPVLALAMLLFLDLDPENPLVTRTAATAVLMAVWWITEAIPIAATAMVPVALFPFLGIMPGKQVATAYFNDIIFLFIGGFIVAMAMQKWNLHRRIALKIILFIGTSPGKVILGFMAATAFLSMWISNTATTMMMVPIAIAVLDKLEESLGVERVGKFAVGLLLGIAYSASIGGIATLIGTPPNLAFVKILKITFPESPDIGFASWMLFGVPFAVVFFFVTWRLLTFMYAPGKGLFQADLGLFREEYRKLGKIRYEESVILAAFALLAFLWIFRKDIPIGGFTIPGWSNITMVPSYIDDGTVAVVMALLLFLIPSRSRPGTRLMDWESAVRLPWGIVVLFGGGFALAAGFMESGLSGWLGSRLTGFSSFSPVLIVIVICLSMTFLTELTSNTATTQMILPILGSLSAAIQVNPLFLMVPATLSASCAFMLPVATPPNAIIFASGQVTTGKMARTGIILNFVGVVLITLAIYLLGRYIFDIDLGRFPNWANTG